MQRRCLRHRADDLHRADVSQRQDEVNSAVADPRHRYGDRYLAFGVQPVDDLIDHGHQQILIRTSGHVAAWPCDEARCPARLTLVRGTARLEALGQPFLFFLSSETGRGNLIYHRYDGHYGLIEPAD